MCVHCLVKLLVRAAIGQNYGGSRHAGLELSPELGATDGIGANAVGWRLSGDSVRPPGVLVGPQARARVVVRQRRRESVQAVG